MAPMRCLELFAGAGGFAEGLKQVSLCSHQRNVTFATI